MAIEFSPQSEASLIKAIEATVNEAVESAMAPIIAEAHDKLDKAIRKRMAEYVMQVMRFYDMHRDNDRLVISVRLPGDTP